MRITVLTDNNTLIDRYFLGEPGFSVYIQGDKNNILFDVGYSGIFLTNANKLGIDIANTDYIAISHGHLDHTWGLDSLVRFYTEMNIEGIDYKKPIVIAHPKTFISIAADECSEIGPLLSEQKISKHFNLSLNKEPQWLDEKHVFLGQIPRSNNFEGKLTFGQKENAQCNDIVEDDTALVYKGLEGLVIVTGCSHSGICNIIEYAKEICHEARIQDVIGGFHLLNPSDEQMEKTLEYFEHINIKLIHPCHCTDLKSKIELSKVVNVKETGVGLKLEFN